MAFQVVLANEAFATSIALELPVAEMCLHMRANVFASAEYLAAILVKTGPFVGNGILLTDVAEHLFRSDASVFKACVNIEIIERLGLLVVVDVKREPTHWHGILWCWQQGRRLREHHFVMLVDAFEERASSLSCRG